MRRDAASLLRRLVPATAAAVGLVVATLAPATMTDAAWTDQEWAHAPVTTLDCSIADGLTSQSTGRVLSGTLVGESLDPVIGLSGIVVENDGDASSALPAGSAPVGVDAYSAPLAVQAIGGLISTELGLPLPLDAGTGSYAQYGQALPDGTSTGAAGVVTDQGAVDLDAARNGSAPRLGTLRLSDLPGAGAALGGIADLSLEIGAIASSATLDGCAAEWSGTATALTRDYLVAGLDLGFASPAVATLNGAATDAVSTLLTGVDGLLANAEAALSTAVVNGLTTLLNGLITTPGLSLGQVSVTASTVTLNPAPLLAVLEEPLTDGVVTVDLDAGTLSVDLAALAGEVHQSSDGLNGLDPNTPVISAEVLTALLDRVGRLLRDPATETGLLYDLERAAAKMVLDAQVHIAADATIRAQVLLVTLDAADVGVTIDATVGDLIAEPPHAEVGVTAAVLNGGLLGSLLAPVNELVATILSSLGGSIEQTLLPTLGAVLRTTLVEPATGLIGTMTTTLVSAVSAALGTLDSELELTSQLVSITVNAQPDQPPGPAPPYPIDAGEYAVSALRIGVVDGPAAGAASILALFLASSTVGPNMS